MKTLSVFITACAVSLLYLSVSAQGPGGPPPRGKGPGGPPPHHGGGPGGGGPGGGPGGSSRVHTETESKPLDLVEANRRAPEDSEISVVRGPSTTEIEANGMPDHLVGRFPNRDNPNEIREQSYDIEIPSEPREAAQITYMHELPGDRFRAFGISLDGVIFEPGTAEVWMGRRDSGWNYEALGGAIPLGLDSNFAHVQPDGSYHYHGMPIGLMRRLGYRKGDHSPMIGWAADGFPIYAMHGYRDANDPGSSIVELKTSYKLRQGSRPGGDEPDGDFDGTFIQDYEYVPGSGDLDECNGRYCVTPEFPEGTYAYFMTREWPVIPRAFRGTPTMIKQSGGRGGPGGRPPFGPPPRR